MSADGTRAAILSRHAGEPLPGAPSDESREERTKRLARERARRSRERRRERQEAERVEHDEEQERESVVQRAGTSVPEHEPVRRGSSGDGRILGAVHGWGGAKPTVLSFRRDEQGPPDYEQWLAAEKEPVEHPARCVTPNATYSVFVSDIEDIARVAELVAADTGIPENDLRATLSRVRAGSTITVSL